MAITTLYLGSNAYTTEDKIYLGDTLVWTASTLANGLVSRYNFNELSGNLLDQVGSNDGTVVGATQNGSEYSFAVNDYVDLQQLAAWDFGTGDFSFTFWFNATSLGSLVGLIDNRKNGTPANGYLIYLNTSSQIQVFLRDTSSNQINVAGTTTLSTGTWYFVSAVFDRSGNVLLKINDSTEINTSLTGVSGDLITSPSKLILGSGTVNISSAIGFFNGSMDNLRIYNRAISAAEVTEIYNLGRS